MRSYKKTLAFVIQSCFLFGHIPLQESAEGFPVGIGDADDLVANIDTVVAIDGPDLVEGDDVGAVDAHEAIGGKHLLDRFHGQVGDDGAFLSLDIDIHVVFQSAHVEDAREIDLSQHGVDPDKHGVGG